MANIKTTFDPKSLVIANILREGETIVHDWVLDEMYQILVTKGTVEIGGVNYESISVNDVQPNTKLTVTGITDSSFLILLRSDNESVIDQILPGDGNITSYYEYMKDFRPEWFDQGVPDNPPDQIADHIDEVANPGWYTTNTLTITTDRLKTFVVNGWG